MHLHRASVQKTTNTTVAEASIISIVFIVCVVFLDPIKTQVSPVVSDWSVKTIWQLWSCPVYGDQLGFINLSSLVWIILEIQNMLTHTHGVYTVFLMTWFHLHTLTHPGSRGRINLKEMTWGKLLWFSSPLVCDFFISVKYSAEIQTLKNV